MKIQREFTRSGLKEVANLADKMEKSEYWELGVKEVSCLTLTFYVKQDFLNLEIDPKISTNRTVFKSHGVIRKYVSLQNTSLIYKVK